MNRNRITLVAGAAALIIVLSIFGYLTWKKSPRYSLGQVRSAFETHDLMKFEKYVDTESLVTRFVDQALAEHMAEQEANGAANALGADFAQGIIQAMKPQLVSTVENQIKTVVENGVDAATEETEGEMVNFAGFFNKNTETNLDYTGVEGTKKDGKVATVTLGFYQPHTKDELKLDVKMRQLDGYWQVAEVSNAMEFIEKADAVKQKILTEKNQPILEEMRKALIVEPAKKSAHSDAYGFQRQVAFELSFKNVGTKDIKAFYGVINASDLSGKIIKSYGIKHDEESLLSGKDTSGVWEFDTNQFIAEEQKLYETPNEQMKIDVQLSQIVFSDGSELKLFE